MNQLGWCLIDRINQLRDGTWVMNAVYAADVEDAQDAEEPGRVYVGLLLE